jgi:hypothetical protein
MSALDFANQHLFTPLGIGPIPAAQWSSDPQGVTIGGYGLALTPREMAKLGYLYLNQGKWEGKTVVSPDWVAASTASHSDRGDKKEYGYLWWIDPQGEWYAALGRGGQHIFVYPAENMVVVFTSDLPFSNDGDLTPLQELLDRYILPAVKSDQPLPANPNSLARLTTGIQTLAQPHGTTPPPLPAMAAEISGKTYALADNPVGWQTMVFSFQDKADEFTVTANGQQVAVGLDDVYRTSTPADSRFPEELRGHWENQGTLVVEDLLPAQMQKFTFRIQFSGDAIDINAQEKYTGGQFEVQGTQSPAGE